MKLSLPPLLGAGDRIGIAAPAGPVREPELEAGMDFLRAHGFTLVEGDHLRARHGYLAGTDRDRLRDLNRLLADPTVKGVWFARGGYGSGRLLGGLDLDPLRRYPKALVGYSDLTMIQAAALRRLGLSTFYGPMVLDLGDASTFDEASLWAAVAGGDTPLRHPVRPATVLRRGEGKGPLLGGCLSLLVSLIGTPFEVQTDGAILFWEEVNEEPYRLDRMLGHLRLAGRLQNLAGMIVGRLVDCQGREAENTLPLEEILEAHLRGTDYPVIKDFPVGHCPGKRTLPLGLQACLETDGGSLTLLRE